jgi:hypothetical protein
MSERVDDRFQEIRLLREVLGSLNPMQTASYQHWLRNAQKHSLQLDLKHCLSLARIIAKGLPRNRESDEIIDAFRSLPKWPSQP